VGLVTRSPIGVGGCSADLLLGEIGPIIPGKKRKNLKDDILKGKKARIRVDLSRFLIYKSAFLDSVLYFQIIQRGEFGYEEKLV
jgi:hypothetical protein